MNEITTSFVIGDTETAGLGASKRIVEIGLMEIDPITMEVTESINSLIDPEIPIQPGATEIHGITDADVASAPSPAQAARQLLDWAGEDVLVGHNVGFDIAFIEKALGDGTRIAPGRYLDTLVLARAAHPDLDDHKLTDLVSFFEVTTAAEHRALADAEATATVLLRLAAELPARVRSFRGWSKSCAGGPDSTIVPPSVKCTSSAISRANRISCVTRMQVMPSRASSRIVFSTSFTVSGSSAAVTSSNSITSGRIASERAIATRCCWPPDSSPG